MNHDRAWYLGATPSQVADRALLVGDRGRIDRIAQRLDRPNFLNDDRGLWTVTGEFAGVPVTAATFGMGAPIATVVLHELSSIGVRAFLRLGTVMRLDAAGLGEMLLAEAAIRGESTSATYVPDGFPAYSDFELQTVIRRELQRSGEPWSAGVYASYDGFYTEMLGLRERDHARIATRIAELRELGVVGLDMETSAILAVARALGDRAASLCLATVAWENAEKLDDSDRGAAEDRLVDIGLSSLAGLSLHEPAIPKG
jgi:uridine phosphorylase